MLMLVRALAGLLVVELRGSCGAPHADCSPSQLSRTSDDCGKAVSWGCYPSAGHVAELLKDLDHRGGCLTGVCQSCPVPAVVRAKWQHNAWDLRRCV